MRVLFMRTGNSARSEIAEALLERFGGPDFEVESAGTEPKGVNLYRARGPAPYATGIILTSGVPPAAASRGKGRRASPRRRY